MNTATIDPHTNKKSHFILNSSRHCVAVIRCLILLITGGLVTYYVSCALLTGRVKEDEFLCLLRLR